MNSNHQPSFACPRCGARTEPRDTACPSCGTPLSPAAAPRRSAWRRRLGQPQLPGEIQVVSGCSGCLGLQYLMGLIMALFLIPLERPPENPWIAGGVMLGLLVLFGTTAWGLLRRRKWGWAFAVVVWAMVTGVFLAGTVASIASALNPPPQPTFLSSWGAVPVSLILTLLAGVNVVLLLRARSAHRKAVDDAR